MKINMLPSINLKKELQAIRNREVGEDIMAWVEKVFKDVDDDFQKTSDKLTQSSKNTINTFDFDKIEVNAIYHISQIEKLCVAYRLRFLDTKYFKGEYPAEAISKIHQLEKEHNTKLDGFKIMAPSVLFRLKKADDPILFAPMGNDYYYLIHKWGNDLHPLRKLKFWAIQNASNLVITLLVLSFLGALVTHQFFFKNHTTFAYFIMLFLFYFKGAIGLTLFYGISLGKNFSLYNWQSEFDKVC